MGNVCVIVVKICRQIQWNILEPFKYEAPTAVFKDPVRTAL